MIKKQHELHIDIATRQRGLAAFTSLPDVNQIHWWFCKRFWPARGGKIPGGSPTENRTTRTKARRIHPATGTFLKFLFMSSYIQGLDETRIFFFFCFSWQKYPSPPCRLDTACSTEAACGYLAAVCVVLKSHR